MADDQTTILFYCTLWCPDCMRARRLLDQRGVRYRCIDIDEDAEGEAFVLRVNAGYRSVPTLVFADGAVLVEPSNAELADRLEQIGLG
jgi:mycoredoxin